MKPGLWARFKARCKRLLFMLPGMVVLFTVMTWWNIHHDASHPVAVERWTWAVTAIMGLLVLLTMFLFDVLFWVPNEPND